MGLLTVLVGAYVWTFRGTLRFPRALVLPLMALASGFLANVVRIAALIALGTFGDVDVALRGFHSKAGWLLFCAIALGTTALARRSRFFLRPGRFVEARENPTALYLAPLLTLLVTALITGLAGDGSLDRSEIIRLITAGVALFLVRDTLRSEWRSGGAISRRATPFAGVVAGVVVFAIWMALDRPDPARAADVKAQLDAAPSSFAVPWLLARVVGSIAVAPLVEELAFRGFLLRRLVDADFTAVAYRAVTPLAVIVSALAFGVLHERFVAGAVAGLIYGALVQRTGRLADAVIAHVVTNALIAVVAVAAGRLDLWA
jgi:exosortase E/protease (VPEID-CTERM system)